MKRILHSLTLRHRYVPVEKFRTSMTDGGFVYYEQKETCACGSVRWTMSYRALLRGLGRDLF